MSSSYMKSYKMYKCNSSENICTVFCIERMFTFKYFDSKGMLHRELRVVSVGSNFLMVFYTELWNMAKINQDYNILILLPNITFWIKYTLPFLERKSFELILLNKYKISKDKLNRSKTQRSLAQNFQKLLLYYFAREGDFFVIEKY